MQSVKTPYITNYCITVRYNDKHVVNLLHVL